MPEQEPFPGGSGIFIENPSPRCPVVLVLDTSYSMSGEKIRQLNEGLRVLEDSLKADELAMKRAEIATVTFGPVAVQQDFVTADIWTAPHLEPQGDTPMGGAIEQAAALIETRRQVIRDNGIGLYRPWMFLITDGAPTDSIARAQSIVRDAEAAKRFMMFAIGVDGADMSILASLSPARDAVQLKGLNFRELFQWLSASLSSVSRSQTTELVALPSPKGWAVV